MEDHYVFTPETMQEKMFEVLGFSDEEAKAQFGFLMEAFEYGTPPHGGVALWFRSFSNAIYLVTLKLT